MIQYRSDKGNWYNLYSQKYTDKHNDTTYIDDSNIDIKIDIPNNKGVSMDFGCRDGNVEVDSNGDILIELLA